MVCLSKKQIKNELIYRLVSSQHGSVMTTIFFPERFDRDTLAPFFEQLELHQDTPDVCVDCSTLRYSFPTAMLVAGSKLRKWIVIRRQKSLRTRKSGQNSPNNVHSYLMHLGFFDFILMGGGNQVGEARGSSAYLPITRIEKPAYDASSQELQIWYDKIMSSVRNLARVVSGTAEDTEENRLYNYALREIIRNVFEHSQATECYVCGQRWWNGRVEIAVIDEGVGIASSLKRSHAISSDNEALHMAIKPGVSSTSNINQSQNIYDNSGFGLYVLSQLASSFGWYVVGSGAARLVGYGNNISEEALNFNGTYFGMQLQRSPQQFSQLLNDIITSGEEEAEASGISKKASGMSKLF
ncbi:ATP-binding protein [Pseudoalteromonas sp. 1_2015MBL_MicDiv]|uniref:ATP-binding protein n=1 Tax=Pseudoalteromonas sp. 1_2015MBL_MicDiv TaxID=1720343 RepID=UPI001E5C4B19|nr:ATP-binding protein [Pseudoalteromonas sp. 1_2015MBL_MicDiv]